MLCLHDELLLHVPEPNAEAVVALVKDALAATGSRWASGSPVRFAVDVRVIRRWSDAKDLDRPPQASADEEGLAPGSVVRNAT